MKAANVSLQELTGRKSGVLLFRFAHSTDVVITDWSGCNKNELPLAFMGRSVIPMKRIFEVVQGEHHCDSVFSEIPDDANLSLDRDDRLADLEFDDPAGSVFTLCTADGQTVTVLIPDGWQ